MLQEEFLQKISGYRAELAAAKNFDDIHRLWQRTSIPYQVSEKNPKSKAYKREILSLYERLTDCSYDVQNELTSTRQATTDEFELGYPWHSKNFGAIVLEMTKLAQIFRALDNAGTRGKRILEFGSGWGNLAIPLAKAGQDVTVVDIDPGFLGRIDRICKRENISISTIEGDFLEACEKAKGKFDAVIFEASFHHCLDFEELLHRIKNKLLTERGNIFFFSEPIFDEYAFPWGIRHDGESLWAVMLNKWLELGFDQSFFSELLLGAGFFMTRIPEVPHYIGHGWRATQSCHGINFAEWELPNSCDATFHKPEGDTGRFCRKQSRLPALPAESRNAYRLTLRNYATHPLRFRVTAGTTVSHGTLERDEEGDVWAESVAADVVIDTDTYRPCECVPGADHDRRDLGVFIAHVATGVPPKSHLFTQRAASAIRRFVWPRRATAFCVVGKDEFQS